MSRRLERLLQLDQLLRNHRSVTIDRLSEELEVSTRTVFYDIAFLRERYNAPISTNEGFYFYDDLNWRMPDAELTQGEIFSLLIGKQMMEYYIGSPFEKELQAAIDSLAKRLPKKILADLQELSNAYRFTVGARVEINPYVWYELHRALVQKHQVRLNYYGIQKDCVTDRVVDPYVIYDVRGNKYLIAYCHLRQGFRNFRLNRIKHVSVLNNRFTPDPDFKLDDYLQQAFNIEINDQSTEVEILFYPQAANYIRERIWHESQEIVERGDGSLLLRMTTSSLGEIKRWILNWGQHAQALKPSSLVEDIQDELRHMQNLYHPV